MKPTYKQVIAFISAFIILLILIETCERPTPQSDRIAILEFQIKQRDSIIANFQTKRDTIKIEVVKIKTQIKEVIIERDKELAPIPDYQLTDSYDWIANKYGFEKIELQPTAVAIQNDPLKAIITDVIRGKHAETELILTKGLVMTLEADIELADGIISEQQANRGAQDKIIKIQQKDIKDEKRQRKAWRALVPIAFVGGFLLGTQ